MPLNRGIPLAVTVLLLGAACSAPDAKVKAPHPAATSPAPPSASQAGAPQVVTGSRPGSWIVRTALETDPMSHASGPAAGSVDLPQQGCGASAFGAPVGEGILTVTLAAPGTSWSNATNTSLVAYASVDGRTPQAIVLFNGGEPFSYQGFLGATGAGAHCVTITVRADLSHENLPAPTVDVFGMSLALVLQGSPAYALESHAPVLYGRSISAKGDTPLITYGQMQPDPDGVDSDLSYTVVWTHEDAGDGMIPPYEWGRWGRVSDIETVLNERVSPNGRILSATYLSCGCEGVVAYPDSSPQNPAHGGETYKPYPSSGAVPGLDQHLGIRDATGNNDVSPSGTTPYRFQQTLVAAPGPGQAREAAMDGNPWTYRVSGEEVAREDTSSSDPRSVLAGAYPQYLIVDISAAARGTSSIAVEVQLAGDTTWYSNDYTQSTAPGLPTTYPFYNGGHRRTVIKLPPGWNGKPISALRLRLNAPRGSTASLVGTPAIELIEITPAYTIERPPFPAPTIVTGVENYPPGAKP